jgi:hypothetical protein
MGDAQFWLDALRTVGGSFIGAGLAFLANNYFQSELRRRANVTAGNLAIAKLERQQIDFGVVKRGCETENQDMLRRNPSAPAWACARPTHFYFPESLKQDYDALSFLLESCSDEDSFRAIYKCEQIYFDLASLIGLHSLAVQELQKKLVEIGVRPSEEFVVGEVEGRLGVNSRGKLTHFSRPILTHP